MDWVDILQGLTMQEVQWKGKEHNCADSCLGDVLVPWPTVRVQLGECVCWIQLSGYHPTLLQHEKEHRAELDGPRKWSKVERISQHCFFKGTSWRARTEFMLKSIHHLQISFTYMSLTHCHLMMGTKLHLSGWMGTVSKASFSKMDYQSPCELPGCVKPIFTQVHIRRNNFIPLGPTAILTHLCFNSSIK